MRTFELLKRDNGHDISNNVTFRIPSSVNEIVCKLTGSSLKEVLKNSVYDTHVSVVRDKLRFASNIIVALFKGPIGSIIEHLESIFTNEDHNINTIVMVGGFSESKYLQQQIRLAFPDKQVIIPEEAGLAVLKGATMFGYNMRQIETRISRYTFGLALTTSFDVHAHPINRLVIEGPLKGKVFGLFSKLVEIGQALDANTCACTQTFVPQDGITYYDACLYASTSANPQFIDEPECFKIGSFVVNCTDQNGEVGSTTLWMCFGGTEIVVLAVHNISGLNTSAVFNLPE
ncbi:hypothetical protein DPMN_157676 [Dreissena polymorpha]|uniref:Uncharacterized protein n=1 Tax=Dreissena polymorpha TaxID=45954 RepID=A0A9D4IQ81_DREPO|nr:hypothetical protein DPMN_157676 [Dreissena polymorpha]